MKSVVVEACGRAYRAQRTEGFLDAFLGIHARDPGVEAVVVSGRSVHGFSLRQAMWVFGIDDQGRDIGGRMLRPMRVVRFAGASAVVEFPEGLVCSRHHNVHTVRLAR